MFLDELVQKVTNVKKERDYKFMLDDIQKNQVKINELQNTLLGRSTFVVNLSMKFKESSEELNQHFDALVLLSQDIEDIKFILSTLRQYVRQIIYSIKQDRAIYLTLLLEQTNIFKKLIEDLKDENKSSSSAQMSAKITQYINKNAEFINRLEKNINDSLKYQESIKMQI